MGKFEGMKCFVGVGKRGEVSFACVDLGRTQGERLEVAQDVAQAIRDGNEVYYVAIRESRPIVIGEHWDRANA